MNTNEGTDNVVYMHQRGDTPHVVHGAVARIIDDVVEYDDVLDVEPGEPVEVDDDAVSMPHQRHQPRHIDAERLDRPAGRPARPRFALPTGRRPMVLTPEQVMYRERIAAKRRDQVRATRAVLVDTTVRTSRGTWRIVSASTRGTYRWVWQPKRAERIDAIEDPSRAEFKGKELSKSRRERFLALLVAAGVPSLYLAVPFTPPVDVPGWVGLAAGAAFGVGAWAAGRPVGDQVDDVAAPVMPTALSLAMSDRAVRATVAEALAHPKVKIDAEVRKVELARTMPAWGWTVYADVIGELTEKHLAMLATILDTPRGGLLVSTPKDSSRARVLRMVMVDLLAEHQVAEPLELTSLAQPARLARRFDGDHLDLRLGAVHIVAIGRSGGGKSTTLHRLLDAFTSAGAVVGGIDMSGGPDVRAWGDMLEPRLSAFGDDLFAVEVALSRAVTIARDRKRRTPAGESWRSDADNPPIRIVVDEFGLVAESPTLRAYVEWLATYGRGVDVCYVLANHRLVADMMGSGRIASQTQVKIILAMDGGDAKQLPKSVRDLGVAPELLIPAHDDVPNDAGKAYVLGVDQVPPLVRFPAYPAGEPNRRAAERAALGRPQLPAADVEAIDAAERAVAGLPALVVDAKAAIIATSANRNPARATTAEIVEYVRGRGHDVTVATLTPNLRAELRNAFPARRKQDTNLPGGNHKGWYLDDLEAACELYLELYPSSGE